jgi:hypothetical protein
MRKVLSIATRANEEEETARYWGQKSGIERLDALQRLREQYIKLFKKEELYRESRKGLRRIYRITRRKRGRIGGRR